VAAYIRSYVRPPHQVHATFVVWLDGDRVVLALLSRQEPASSRTAIFFTRAAGRRQQDLSDAISSPPASWWCCHHPSMHVAVVSLDRSARQPRTDENGRKSLPTVAANPAAAAASNTRAWLLAGCGAVVWWIVNRLHGPEPESKEPGRTRPLCSGSDYLLQNLRS
jgi:hypothetical protein